MTDQTRTSIQPIQIQGEPSPRWMNDDRVYMQQSSGMDAVGLWIESWCDIYHTDGTVDEKCGLTRTLYPWDEPAKKTIWQRICDYFTKP